MTTIKIGRRILLSAPLLASVALTFAPPAGSLAASAATNSPKQAKPRVVTAGALHVHGSTALLSGVVYPNGTETNYYFQYGTTTTYGSQTPTLAAGGGSAKVSVGQPIAGLTSGVTYHFRLVGIAAGKTLDGHDKTFLAGTRSTTRLAFRLDKTKVADVFGTPFVISGVLSGVGNANQAIALQASPYPYLEPFVTVGAPGATNAAGAFSFRVSNLALSTQFRVITFGKLPLYSPVLTEAVAVHVILHVRATRAGLVRLYGTVTPAKVGARVYFQLEKAVRPHGNSERSVRLLTMATTVLKRSSSTFSRFSAVVKIARSGRYVATVKLPKGALVTGTSNGVVLHAVKHKGKG